MRKYKDLYGWKVMEELTEQGVWIMNPITFTEALREEFDLYQMRTASFCVAWHL